MSQRIVIDPVTRIEGHAKISIQLDDQGQVEGARFHVTEFRGFEKFCLGRPFWEMPGITARICGICPISHILGSAKAGDAILAVKVSEQANKLRRLMNLGQYVQSHALSFFHLSAPDFLLGWDSDPASRNVFGLIKANPDLARKGIRLRQFGQEIISLLGGSKIHPAWAVPGGVRGPLTTEGIDWIKDRLPEANETAELALTLFKGMMGKFKAETQIFGNFPSLFMSLVGPDGEWEHHDGGLRFVDAAGNILADHVAAADYQTVIGEAVEPWSYLKFPYFKLMGYPAGGYRVGPLARLNCAEHMQTPRAERELQEFKSLSSGSVNNTFLYHYARLVEIIAALDAIERLVDDPDILSDMVRADAGVNNLRGVGITEAPRGTLFHDYTVNRDGLLEHVNLIVSTGQNNLAMNRTVEQIAKHYVHGEKIEEGMLNRVEAGIRCYDPCLSCSTHAIGQMPMEVSLLAANGSVLDTVARG
ncbi:MAG: Ni/Fe hydrogenase subunit alpha [Armatimonadetes bacterium]|nr:Ni/Fe hydrogenase subunit alpha [Armatimonadota bacterium]